MADEKKTPAAKSAPSPARVCDPNDRAPGDGSLRRFKIRCTNYGPRVPKYVLAADEAAARACYLAAEGIDAEVARLKADGADKIEPPHLAVTTLPD